MFLHTPPWVLTSAEPLMTHCCPENATRNNTSDLLSLCLKPYPQVGHHCREWRSYFWPCWAKGGSGIALVYKLYFTPRVINIWYKYTNYGAPPSQQSSLLRTSLSTSFSYQKDRTAGELFPKWALYQTVPGGPTCSKPVNHQCSTNPVNHTLEN